jgi:hypothetical protein
MYMFVCMYYAHAHTHTHTHTHVVGSAIIGGSQAASQRSACKHVINKIKIQQISEAVKRPPNARPASEIHMRSLRLVSLCKACNKNIQLDCF